MNAAREDNSIQLNNSWSYHDSAMKLIEVFLYTNDVLQSIGCQQLPDAEPQLHLVNTTVQRSDCLQTA
jgi:hypothetical protein